MRVRAEEIENGCRWSAKIMGRISTHGGWKQIDRLFEAGSLVGLTDRQLLERFIAGEAAEATFEALVDRHGPMVRAVCRSMLRDSHEADDAFQATFLVLARRAGSIRRRDALASWLYGVACRVAARARADAGRRRMLGRYLAERARLESTGAEHPNEPMPELLEEVARLPERYRGPIVLCYMEGQSHEQAAGVLGCPVRTIETRLQRGKARLRDRLVRRGLAPAAGLTALGIDAAEATPAVMAGSVPAALSESTARASVQFAATRAAGLATTAMGLAQVVLESLFWARLRRAAGLVLGLSLGLALTFFAWAAAGQKSEKPAATITGRILDDQARPISGAEVWMQVGFENADDTTSHATADALGRYALPVPGAWSRTPPHARHGIVWAHASGHRINTASAYAALSGKAESLDLTLGPATDTSFVVFGPDGRPVADALVEPHHVLTPINAYLYPPRAMLPAIRAVTDGTGRALLPAMPRAGFRAVRVTAGSLGSQQLVLNDQATEPARREIRLRAAGRIEGRVVADRPEWVRGLKVYVSTTETSDPYRVTFKAQGDDIATTGPDGSFVIPAIAAGKLVIGTRVDEALPVRPIAPDGLEVRANQTTRVEIPLTKAVRLRGVIRVKGTGEPIPEASVSVSYGWKGSKNEGSVAPTGSSTVVSDANGRYETYGFPGDASMQVISMPEPFIQMGQPWAERHRVPEGVATFDLPPIEAVRGITIKGRLVDAEDRPVADLKLFGMAEGQGYGFGKTGSQGEFTLSSAPPGLKFSYKVWLDDREPPVDAEILKEEPLLLRVEVDRRSSAAAPAAGGVSGTVLEAGGRPIEGVEVNLMVETGNKQKRETLTTDARGVYRDAHPVVKGTMYRAIVEPGRYAIAASEAVAADGTDPLTLPPITAVRMRTIIGRVVDTAGRPVAGARVRNWGNPAPLSDAVTGPTGRFQLDGFPRERAYLFVDTPGFRFHRATPDPGKSTTDLIIRRENQPPERGIVSLGPPIARERVIRLAETVLKPYAERIIKPGTDREARSRALEVAAEIDPDGAWRKCQAGEAPWDSNPVRIAAVRHLAASRPGDAEAIIPTIKNDFWRQSVRIELVDALPPAARDHKLALLNEAALEASQTSDASYRVHHLSEVIRRLIDLGQGAEARRLLDETLPRAQQSDAADPRLGNTRALIGSLARLDLKAALALIPAKGHERTINDLRGLVAQSIAAQHPDEAERLIGQMTWDNSETYAVKACHRMATVDLPRARRIAARIKIDVLRGFALGRMAEAVGERDQATARQLQAESFRAFEAAMGKGPGGVWGARAAAIMAAALLSDVERTDPDRLAEVVDRVLSLRWYPRSILDVTSTRPDTSGIDAMRSDAALAAILARYDHELARSIARPIIDRLKTPLTKDESRFFDRYAVLPCLALADPEATAALVEVIPDLKEEGIGQSRDISRLIVAGALAAPESRFWTVIRRVFSDLEIVERED
jgi:RNA polymerase sigma factor (sigma-70 family)